jgi:arylsulfatase A-like enzyme
MKVWDGPVSIEDITATLLHYGGCKIPDYFDSIPLPGLGIDAKIRERVFGFLGSGCMNYDGQWKLSKYTTGVVQLFNVKDDPGEQNNRVDDPECFEIFRRLDAELTAQTMRSITAAHSEKLVNTSWDDLEFGRGGWKRTYPQPI